jgi:hypothetical protein
MPGGYARAAVAVPILLTVPGALTLGALAARDRLPGIAFSCLSALLSVLWTVFASLALYILHVLITPASTYLCLTAVCAALAAIAQARMGPGRRGGNRRNARETDHPRAGGHRMSEAPTAPDVPAVPEEDADPPSAFRRAAYSVAALAVGGGLLAGATQVYLDVPHPAPSGYTWIAWSGKQVTGTVAVGPAGTTLPFQIEHQQPGTAAFRLTAAWMGASQQHALTRPLTLNIGPDKAVHGTLTIPSPPGPCTYRIVVTLTALGGAHPQSWSINADVRGRGPHQETCAS